MMIARNLMIVFCVTVLLSGYLLIKKLKIPIQHESSSRYSGTDTDNISYTGKGIPSALVSLPLRYMHSVVETVDLDDVEKVVSLLVGFVKSVRPSDNFDIKL